MTSIPNRGTLPILQAGTPLAQATGALILLHGRGGNAGDILGLGSALAGGRLALLAPQAPGHTWYPLSFLAPRQQNEPYLSSALKQVEATLMLAIDSGLKPSQIAFCGFSQGACLATEFVGRHPQPYAGLVAFTGGLIGPLDEPISLTGDLGGTPVLLSSGDPDPHVPWKRVQQSGDLLSGIGAMVSLKRYPGRAHTVLPEEVENGKKMLSGLIGTSALGIRTGA
jgi:phospholipase/carboxylesterase